MDEIIKKIIQIEKKADKLVDDAKGLKENVLREAQKDADPEIVRLNNEIDKQIELLQQESEKRVNDGKEKIKADFEKAKKVLNDKYDKEHEKWEQLIFEKIFG